MRRRRSQFSFFGMLFWLAGAAVLLTGGVVGTMLATGTPLENLAFWRGEEEEPPSIRLPINLRPLIAYERVRREDLLDPATGRLATLPVPLTAVKGIRVNYADTGEEAVGRIESVEDTDDGLIFHLQDGKSLPANQVLKVGGAFLHATDIVGRVLKREKTPRLAFSETSFFEKGTPAGLAGATPPGMRTLTLPADSLTGVHRVSQGERIDLVANVPLARLERFELATSSRLPGSQLVASTRGSRDSDRETTARLVASQALVLTPVVRRVEQERTNSLANGGRILSVPVEEVVLAVAAEDVAAVTAARELRATINVLVRSGRPGASDADRRPAPEGTVPVPIPGKTLMAYQSIDAAVFQEAATGYIRYAYLESEAVEKAGWITDLKDFIGRIPNRDLPVGQPIPASSLMPVGTPDGLAGATPAGRVLFFLDRETLVGADAFGFSQHLDIVASVTNELVSNEGGVPSSQSGRAQVQPVANDVIVVLPTRSPANPTIGPDDDGAGQLVLAIRPSQIGPLQAAIAGRSQLRATSAAAPTKAPAGTIAVPIPGAPLLAYQRMDTSVFEEAASGTIRSKYLSKQNVAAADWVTDVSELVGRIPNRDLPVGQPIPRSSLMPLGTPDGLTGATPRGRVLFFLDPEDLAGADAFGFSQHLDIVASVTDAAGPVGGIRLSASQRTRVAPIADDVVVVMPTRSPANPTAGSGENESGQLILAVRPDQVGPLQFAVATEARLRATVRSAAAKQSDRLVEDAVSTDIDARAMSFNPLRNAKVTDLNIKGRRQKVLFVPKVGK